MLPDFSAYSLDSVAANIMVSGALQKMKLSDSPLFSWISEVTPKTTLLLSAVAAAITAAGMMVNWETVNGVGTLTVSGITPESVASFVWNTAKNFTFQEGAYRAFYKPREVPPTEP